MILIKVTSSRGGGGYGLSWRGLHVCDIVGGVLLSVTGGRILVQNANQRLFGVSLRLWCECQCTMATDTSVAPLGLGCRAPSRNDPL